MECLLTTLKATVTNDSLLKVGEFPIFVNNTGVQALGLNIGVSADTTIKLTGGATFVENGTDTMVYTSANSYHQINAPLGVFSVRIMNKYNITLFGKSPFNYLLALQGGGTTYPFTITGLDFSLLTHSNLTSLNFQNAGFTSSIDGLKNSALNYIYINNEATSPKMTLSGDIASLLKTANAITFFNIAGNPQLAGSIDSFAGKTLTPTTFALNGTSVTGDIGSFAGVAVSDIKIQNTKITGGDLGALNDATAFIAAAGTNGAFTFTAFSGTRQYVLTFSSVRMPDSSDVDAFLIANAALAVNPDLTQSWYKTISILGSRTSASDAAVATLQGNGITVTLTPLA